MSVLFDQVLESAEFIKSRMPFVPKAALILGTGLGGTAERMKPIDRLPYSEIPYFPLSTVESHKGDLVFAVIAQTPTVIMQGRFHYYEGYSLHQVTAPVRALRKVGAEMLIINSACGGLNPHCSPGDLMIVTDHINLLGDNPLRGMHDQRLGERFLDQTNPYDQMLMRYAEQTAEEKGIPISRGVYVCVAGPSLETRAETRMLRMLGADAVGMSTVPEVIVAGQVGFRTLVIGTITNVNIPDQMTGITTDSVIENAKRSESRVFGLLEGILERELLGEQSYQDTVLLERF